jgi:hypothetical protein
VHCIESGQPDAQKYQCGQAQKHHSHRGHVYFSCGLTVIGLKYSVSTPPPAIGLVYLQVADSSVLESVQTGMASGKDNKEQ